MTQGYLTKNVAGHMLPDDILSISDYAFLRIGMFSRGAYLYLIHFIISPIDGFLPYISMPTL